MFRTASTWLLAAGVLALAGWLVLDHMRDDSPTWDELLHIVSGYHYVRTQTLAANPEHPPLMKDLAGLALLTLPIRSWDALGPNSVDLVKRSVAFAYLNTASPEAILWRARLPFVAVFLALGIAVFLWARALHGNAGGIAALALVALNPNFIGHASIVHTDVGASLFVLVTVALLWLWLRDRTWWACVLTGVALGAALATKFSTTCVAQAVVLSVLYAYLWRWGFPGGPKFREQAASARAAGVPGPGKDLVRLLVGTAVFCAIALGVLLCVYQWNIAGMPAESQVSAIRANLSLRHVPDDHLALVLRVREICPPLGHYLAGLSWVMLQDWYGAGVSWVLGRHSATGFWYYFPLAFFLKMPLPLLVAIFTSLWLRRHERRTLDGGIVWIVVAVFLFVAMGSSYNIGVRHIFPIVPLLAVWAGGIVPRLLALPSGWKRRAAVAFLALLAADAVAEPLLVHPHELSYFNQIAGGSRNGDSWLSDSNVDWGQDLKRLGDWARANGSEDLNVAYAGVGVVSHYLPKARVLREDSDLVPGRYAVSVFYLTVGPVASTMSGNPVRARFLRNLRAFVRSRGIEVGRVGYSIRVFDVAPKGEIGVKPPPGGAGGA